MSPEFVYEAAVESDTDLFGSTLAALLPDRAVVTLDGPLGAGKTRLVRAVAAALEVDPRDVTSPTFVLVQEYHGRRSLFHFDAYRLSDELEFWELGPSEYFARPGVSFIEWAERVSGCLPSRHLSIHIEITGDTARRFHVAARGEEYDPLVSLLAARLGR